MATKSNQLRSRYGICLNDQCPLSKEKKIQEVVGRKELICSECGKPLKECRPPRSWWEKNGKKVIIAAVLVVVAAIGSYFGFIHKKSSSQTGEWPGIDTILPIDSLKVDSIDKGPVPPPPDGSINLGYGRYKGESKDGKPHGHGTITYTQRHKIISSKEYVANPGDRYEGEFRDGKVSGGIGYWHHNGDITAIKP